MNLSIKGFPNNKDAKLNLPNKLTTLNPNAAEFVPSAHRYTVGDIKSADATRLDIGGASGKAVLDRSESSTSNNSDDEAHQYWRHQLPDDITPDFKVMGKDELHGPENLSLAALSLHDSIETSRFSASAASQLLGTRLDISSHGNDSLSLSEKVEFSGSTHVEEQSSAALMTLATNPWDKGFINGDNHLTNGREGHHYHGNSSAGFNENLLSERVVLEETSIDTLEFLASQFPGFSAASLADVYYANGCDLSLTIDILTQLELQVDGGFSQHLNSKALLAPSLGSLDFPALPEADAQNGWSKHTGQDLHRAPNTYRSPSSVSRGSADFASAVRRLAFQGSGNWKYERNGPADGSIGSSRSSQLLANSFSGNGKLLYGDKLQGSDAVRAAPVWLETGKAVSNMYSESRDEARDFARLRNACFEQARQAYLIGNNVLAKELSVKGQLYNMQMKAAHEKARETIYRQRNPVASELQGYNGGQDRLIDLHGLHVSEAIHVLKHELSILRRTARSAGQRLQVMICVGTGHHTKGTRTPARLPIAVEQYLLEEGLHYTQPQPGLLRVVIY